VTSWEIAKFVISCFLPRLPSKATYAFNEFPPLNFRYLFFNEVASLRYFNFLFFKMPFSFKFFPSATVESVTFAVNFLLNLPVLVFIMKVCSISTGAGSILEIN